MEYISQDTNGKTIKLSCTDKDAKNCEKVDDHGEICDKNGYCKYTGT